MNSIPILTSQQILEACVDVKGQQVVSLPRLAEVLGIEPLTKEEIYTLVEDNKNKNKPMSKL